MADITRQRVGEILRKLFEILLAHPDGMRAKDALSALAKSVTMTEYERGNYESGGRRFEKIVRFATVDCVKAGWLAKNKGSWSITEAGMTAYNQLSDPEAFYQRAQQLYKEWRATTPVVESPKDEEIQDEGGIKSASITYEQAEEQAWQEIDQYLRNMQPYDFQDLVASLLRAMGYHISWIAPPGKDGGLDIVALVDPLGTRPPRIKVQVKRQGQSVNVEGVRSFMAVLGEDDVGLFVSIGGFTKDAADEVRRQESRRVTLIDLERLFDLWVEHYGKLTDDARRRLPLQPIYFIAPEP
jgi:restriction system protein